VCVVREWLVVRLIWGSKGFKNLAPYRFAPALDVVVLFVCLGDVLRSVGAAVGLLGGEELRIQRVLRRVVHGKDGRGSGELFLGRQTRSGGCEDGFARTGHFSAKERSEWGGAAT
jgi:hypothetical protein